jgi:hypothetical protein
LLPRKIGTWRLCHGCLAQLNSCRGATEHVESRGFQGRRALAQTAGDTEQLATSTMAASGNLSSQSGLLTREIRTYLDHARENLVDQAGAAKRAA